jgi:hypothetical protein
MRHPTEEVVLPPLIESNSTIRKLLWSNRSKLVACLGRIWLARLQIRGASRDTAKSSTDQLGQCFRRFQEGIWVQNLPPPKKVSIDLAEFLFIAYGGPARLDRFNLSTGSWMASALLIRNKGAAFGSRATLLARSFP